MYSEQNPNKRNINQSRNIDGIFFAPKIKKIKRLIEDNKLIPTYSNILEIVEKRKPNRAQKILMAVCAILLFAIMPIKLLNTGNATKAYAKNSVLKMDRLYQSIENGSPEDIKKNIASLQEDIGHINDQLSSIGQRNIFISKFFPFKNSSTNTENILDIASSLLNIGAALADDILYFQTTKIDSIANNDNNNEFFTKIRDLNGKLVSLEKEVSSLDLAIKSIKQESLSEKEKKYFDYLKDNFDTIKTYYNASLKTTEILPSMLGENFDKKYLILFQNNTELRPTGGFMGSYGIVTIRDAKIKDIFVDSIYNPDGQIKQIIEPPEPLKKITDQLGMRDANWDPNFPNSARLITELYEEEGGFTPDGIIAVDTKPFLDLLKITGPIYLEDYSIEINEGNFIETTQYKTSIDYNPGDKNPKKFLHDFAPIFLERVMGLDTKNQNKSLGILLKNITEKHIQFYSFDERLQKIFSDLEASGEIKSTDGDYFLYINANIGGMKTSDKIIEKLEHKITLNEQGNIVHEVVISREHSGGYDWPGGINYSYMRFYIPEGSRIMEIENFEKDSAIKKNPETGMLYLEEKIDFYPGKAGVGDLDTYQEQGKMVVGVWQVLKPGEKLISKIKYETPIKMGASSYSLLIQKQPGIISQETSIEVIKNGKKFQKEFDLFEDRNISIETRK